MAYSFDPRWDSPPPMRRMNGHSHASPASPSGSSDHMLPILLSIERRVGEVAGDVKVLAVRQTQIMETMDKSHIRIDKLESKPATSTSSWADLLKSLPLGHLVSMLIALLLGVAGILSPIEAKKILVSLLTAGK